MNVPLISNIQELKHPMLVLEEKATDAYYIPHSPKVKQQLKKQELTGPIII